MNCDFTIQNGEGALALPLSLALPPIHILVYSLYILTLVTSDGNQTEIMTSPSEDPHPFESLSLATRVVIYIVALLLALGCVTVSIICPLVLLCWKRRIRNPYLYVR